MYICQNQNKTVKEGKRKRKEKVNFTPNTNVKGEKMLEAA